MVSAFAMKVDIFDSSKRIFSVLRLGAELLYFYDSHIISQTFPFVNRFFKTFFDYFDLAYDFLRFSRFFSVFVRFAYPPPRFFLLFPVADRAKLVEIPKKIP